MKKSLWSVLCLGALLVGAQVAYAALTDSQQYTVTVGKNVSIVAPTAAQTKTYSVADLTAAESVSDDTYTFPVQSWHAKGNVKNGVSVQFSMPAFNESTLAVQQDGGLSVALGSTNGPATWSALGPTTSSSNYANTTTVLGVTTPNPLNANVSYRSNGVGQANFGVAVTFLATDINAVAAGSYVTVVTGTLTEN